MADDIADLIDQLLAENDLEKQRVILAQVSKFLAEEREQRESEKMRPAS